MSSIISATLARAARGLPAAALLLACVPAHAQSHYTIDPRFGSITFTVADFGLFTSRGRFDRFDADLEIDPAHLERTQIAVDVAAGSVDMPWQDATAMLRSPDFFDVGHHPHIRFTSTGVVPLGTDTYAVHGRLEIRGVTRPMSLTARLIDRKPDPASGAESADFMVSGNLNRSDFGMVADPMVISDKVSISIHARIRLAAETAHGG